MMKSLQTPTVSSGEIIFNSDLKKNMTIKKPVESANVSTVFGSDILSNRKPYILSK